MPRLLIKPIVGAATGVASATMISERKLMGPKAIVLFYTDIAKSCYVATGSKRIACTVAALACGTALVPVPGPHQGPFIVACAAARGADKI